MAHVQDGMVNYPGLSGDKDFMTYLEDIGRFDPSRLDGQAERLAFWINAYNALAIKGILDGLSPKGWIGKYRYFVATDYQLGNKKTNLYDLEHQIILPYGDPRVHFALVCASASCPKLRSEAYTAQKLEAQLEEQARIFVNDESRNRFDTQARTAYLSQIFDWFSDDFEGAGGTVLNYIAGYTADPRLQLDLRSGSYEIEYLEYDWSLNGPAPTRP